MPIVDKMSLEYSHTIYPVFFYFFAINLLIGIDFLTLHTNIPLLTK